MPLGEAQRTGPVQAQRTRKLSPRGAIAVALILLVAAGCVRLGFWQLDRLEQRRARNALVREALALPTLSLGPGDLRQIARDPGPYLNRRVRLLGTYDLGRTIIVRGRSREGKPGVEIVSPLQTPAGGAAVLVNRGWVLSPDAATVSVGPLAEPGEQEIEGLIQPIPDIAGDGTPALVPSDGDTVLSVQRLNAETVGAWLPYAALPIYIQQLPAPGLREPPIRRPLPELSEGPHLGYAVQWFSFAAIALGGLAVLLFRQSE